MRDWGIFQSLDLVSGWLQTIGWDSVSSRYERMCAFVSCVILSLCQHSLRMCRTGRIENMVTKFSADSMSVKSASCPSAAWMDSMFCQVCTLVLARTIFDHHLVILNCLLLLQHSFCDEPIVWHGQGQESVLVDMSCFFFQLWENVEQASCRLPVLDPLMHHPWKHSQLQDVDCVRNRKDGSIFWREQSAAYTMFDPLSVVGHIYFHQSPMTWVFPSVLQQCSHQCGLSEEDPPCVLAPLLARYPRAVMYAQQFMPPPYFAELKFYPPPPPPLNDFLMKHAWSSIPSDVH